MSDLNKQKDHWISQMNNSIQAFQDHIFKYMINRQYELVPHHEVKPVLPNHQEVKKVDPNRCSHSE